MATNNLIYDVNDKPSWGKTIVFALQQLLAIMAATIAVPMIVGNGLSTSAALFGAGVGTIVYLLFTKSKSPVFLGSSFAFLGSMFAAFAGAASMSMGYLGIIIGAVFAGLVYVILSLICKFCGRICRSRQQNRHSRRRTRRHACARSGRPYRGSGPRHRRFRGGTEPA